MATAKKSAAKAAGPISLEVDVRKSEVVCKLLGTSPLITNAMSGKSQKDLILPPGRKTAADKAQSMKHDPLMEFRNSMYTANDGEPTRILMPATAFKACVTRVAVDVPGATKAAIGRLVQVEGAYVSIYGIPQIMSSVVRNSDINKTPDVRTRAVLPEWCAEVTLTHIETLITAKTIASLMQAAGMIMGIGDWRGEKGSGNYGGFEVVSDDDERWAMTRDIGGQKAQDAAIEDPKYFDSETRRLLEWFYLEVERRGLGKKLSAVA